MTLAVTASPPLVAAHAPSASPAGPPPNPEPVYGYVEQGGGLPAANATVWVNDTTSGASLTNVTDSEGRYQVDLASSANGYAQGDTVNVTATWNQAVGYNQTTLTLTVGGEELNVTLSHVPPLTVGLSASPNPVQTSAPTTLTANRAGGYGPFSFSWSFGDGTTGVSASPTISHTYTEPGSFQANVTVTDSQSNVASASTTITVQTPALTLSYAPTSPEAGAWVTFSDALSVPADGWAFNWTFGDGGTAGPLAPGVTTTGHDYTAEGNYTVRSVATNVTDHALVVSNAVEVQVTSGFTVSLSASPDPTEVSLPTTFLSSTTGSGTPSQYEVDFGDGDSSGSVSVGSVTHTYASAGNLTASVTATNATGQTATVTTPVTVLRHIGVDWSANSTSGKSPLAVAFVASAYAGSGHYRYAFTIGGVTYPSNTTGGLQVNVQGSGSVIAEVQATDGLGVSAYANLTLTLTQGGSGSPLTAALTGPGTATTGEDLSFSVSVSGGTQPYTYSWSFGDGTTPFAGGPTESHAYASAGTYTVTVWVNDSAQGHVAKQLSVAVTSNAPPPTNGTQKGGFLGTGISSLLFLLLLLILVAVLVIVVIAWRRKKDQDAQAEAAARAAQAAAASGLAAAAVAPAAPAVAPPAWDEEETNPPPVEEAAPAFTPPAEYDESTGTPSETPTLGTDEDFGLGGDPPA